MKNTPLIFNPLFQIVLLALLCSAIESSAFACSGNDCWEPGVDLVCDAGSSQTVACAGASTQVTLDGSGSYDPDDGVPVAYHWEISCDDPNAVVSGAGSARPVITLNNPGRGVPARCTAVLTVLDGEAWPICTANWCSCIDYGLAEGTSCSTTVDVRPCSPDCQGVPNGSARPDVCGVCAGDGRSCLDCAGVPFGTARADSCGVCGGDGKSCLDCAGIPFGPAKQDICGVCNGNGKSCVMCEKTSNISAIGTLKFNSKKLSKIALEAVDGICSDKVQLKKTYKIKALKLQKSLNTTIGQLPLEGEKCQNVTCVAKQKDINLAKQYNKTTDLLAKLVKEARAQKCPSRGGPCTESPAKCKQRANEIIKAQRALDKELSRLVLYSAKVEVQLHLKGSVCK